MKVEFAVIKAKLIENYLFIVYQFGFRFGISTVDQTVSHLKKNITRLSHVVTIIDLLFFDFSKVFDKVCYDIILCKSSETCIKQEILFWLNLFTTQRSLQVKISVSVSQPVSVTSGISQGTVLGLSTFVIPDN